MRKIAPKEVSPGVRRNAISYKNIKITDHAMLRSKERLGINSKSDLQKLCCSARYKGVNLNSLRTDTYQIIGLSYKEYRFIKERFSKRTNSTNIYLYNGCVFIFVGNGGKTLKTIVNLNSYNI